MICGLRNSKLFYLISDPVIVPRYNQPRPPAPAQALFPRQMPVPQQPVTYLPQLPYFARGCVPMGGMPWMAGFGQQFPVAVSGGYGYVYGNTAPIYPAPQLPYMPPPLPSKAPGGTDVLWEWYRKNEDEPYAEGEILDDLALRSGLSRGEVQKWLCNRRHRDGKAKNTAGRRAKKGHQNDKKRGKQ